jgi:putative phosphoesterase
MRLAIISDLHSNIYALERVLEDIENRDVDRVFCAGDLVGYAPFPNEVVEKIREEDIRTVQGNYDNAVGNNKITCGCDYKTEREEKIGLSSLNFTGEETSEENKEFLRDLPQNLELEVDDYEVLLVHGSPRKLNEYLYAESEELVEVVAELEEDILICGHTHLPYHRLVGEKHVINVGSIGKPKHGNSNSVYAIVEVKNENVRVEFIEVPYPVEKVTSKVRDTDLANELIEIFEGGG